MARVISFKAILNFSFASHAELTSMRTAAIAFATAQSGTYDIITREDPDGEGVTYFGKLVLDLPASTRVQAAGYMTTIDSQLSGLPDLTMNNGFELEYEFVERKIAE